MVTKPDRRKRAGFSMTELLVVVAVILILVSLLFIVGGRMYGQSRLLQCQHHLEQIGRAMNMYAVGHQGTLPAPRSLGGRLWYETLAATHLDDGRILGCPLVGPPPHIRVHEEPVTMPEEPSANFDKVLYWLRQKQIKEGADAGRIPMSSAVGYYRWDNVMTACSLMAFVGAGITDRDETFGDTVRMAVEYLIGPAQMSSGQYVGQTDGRLVGNHSMTLMGLVAAYQSLEDPALRSQVRQSVGSGLTWLAQNSNDLGTYNYAGAAPPGENCRMTMATWVYQAVGMAQGAGFTIPGNLRTATQFFLNHNAASDGRMAKQWNPDNPGTWISGFSGSITHHHGLPLLSRVALGEGRESSTVLNLIDHITQPVNGVPRYMQGNIGWGQDGFRESRRRMSWFHGSRGLRILGGPEWDAWLDPAPEYGWQGFPYHISMYLADDGYDDEGNPTAYWPGNIGLVAYDSSYMGRDWTTSFSAMMFSDAFHDSWLDEDYIPPIERTCSYGYNSALGRTRATVPAGTIMIMDYDNWLIRRGTGDPEGDDDDSRIALRHLGRANALMGDGSVRALYLEEITPRGMWTLERGD